MATQRQPEPDRVPEMTPAEMWETFDQIARRRLGMSGEEFIRRYDAAEIDVDDPAVHSGTVMLEMLLPAVRAGGQPR